MTHPETRVTTPVTIPTASNTFTGQRLRPGPTAITTTPAAEHRTQHISWIGDEENSRAAPKTAATGGATTPGKPRIRPAAASQTVRMRVGSVRSASESGGVG